MDVRNHGFIYRGAESRPRCESKVGPLFVHSTIVLPCFSSELPVRKAGAYAIQGFKHW